MDKCFRVGNADTGIEEKPHEELSRGAASLLLERNGAGEVAGYRKDLPGSWNRSSARGALGRRASWPGSGNAGRGAGCGLPPGPGGPTESGVPREEREACRGGCCSGQPIAGLVGWGTAVRCPTPPFPPQRGRRREGGRGSDARGRVQPRCAGPVACRAWPAPLQFIGAPRTGQPVIGPPTCIRVVRHVPFRGRPWWMGDGRRCGSDSPGRGSGRAAPEDDGGGRPFRSSAVARVAGRSAPYGGFGGGGLVVEPGGGRCRRASGGKGGVAGHGGPVGRRRLHGGGARGCARAHRGG